MDLLTRRWRADCRGAVPAADPGAVDAVGADLLTRWREPHRAYHDPVHLAEVLAAVDTLSAAERLATPGAHPVAILAGWFHDVVYEPTPPRTRVTRSPARTWPATASRCSARARSSRTAS